MRELPQRQRPAHFPSVEIRGRSVVYFITVCVNDRRPLLASPEALAVLMEAWQIADAYRVGRFVVMPDHVHLFCGPARHPEVGLKPWVAFWKSRAAQRWTGGAVRTKLWQRDFWDTQLRAGESYREKWEYVRNNPVRAGLVARPDDWPYQGELGELRWHE